MAVDQCMAAVWRLKAARNRPGAEVAFSFISVDVGFEKKNGAVVIANNSADGVALATS